MALGIPYLALELGAMIGRGLDWVVLKAKAPHKFPDIFSTLRLSNRYSKIASS